MGVTTACGLHARGLHQASVLHDLTPWRLVNTAAISGCLQGQAGSILRCEDYSHGMSIAHPKQGPDAERIRADLYNMLSIMCLMIILGTMTVGYTISPSQVPQTPKLLPALIRRRRLTCPAAAVYTECSTEWPHPRGRPPAEHCQDCCRLPGSLAHAPELLGMLQWRHQAYLAQRAPLQLQDSPLALDLRRLLIFSTEQGSQVSRLVAYLCYVDFSRLHERLPSHLACHLRASVQLVLPLRATSKTKV